MSRMLSERLFAHVMRLPLKFHLERQTGAISQTLDNGLNGYQMVLHTLVFTVVPVATELGTIVVVLSRLEQPAFVGLFAGAIGGGRYGCAFLQRSEWKVMGSLAKTRPDPHNRRSTAAGWSSLAARRAHNPKVAGSNPAPATSSVTESLPREAFLLLQGWFVVAPQLFHAGLALAMYIGRCTGS